MRKVFLRVAAVVGALVAAGVLGLVVFVFVLRPKSVAAPTRMAPKTPEAIERGRYLANHAANCVGCHSDAPAFKGDGLPEERTYVGRDVTADMAAAGLKGPMGKIVARNLTSGRGGIGEYSDGELVRAIRDGIGRDGRALFPMMPYREYAAGLSEDDAFAIVAYLRTLPARDSDLPTSKLSLLSGTIARLTANPAGTVPNWGGGGGADAAKQLLVGALCATCHNTEGASYEAPDFAGGSASNGVPTPNITSDPAVGVGSYSEADIIKALEGVRKDGGKIREMPTYLYSGMSQEDKVAIAKAVRSLPPVSRLGSRK